MRLRSWLSELRRFPRLTKLPLGIEIALILAIKIALLTVLAKTFFSEPQAKKMRVPTDQVVQHMLSPAIAAPSPTAFTSPSEATHDSNR
ncbi:cytochrome oxidase putative small subunit CydP [Herbaspirillum autotrophicum]|uniref:cytochrome oxidase putative small subunit CydP n=1 Tax=Herbaspirillum autotrophicum TaxID=180195 RepID=UPI00067D7F2B|nr:cytochrome oxidase putative small subunit CydP [Herbaspirillum autotrophicum]